MHPLRVPSLALLCASLLLAAAPVRAEGPGPDEAQAFLATVFPEAPGGAAPDWLKAGTRLCYRGLAVPVAEESDWSPDPAGDWVDLRTNQRKSDADLWSAGTVGEGLTQVDVVQLSARRAVLSASSYRVPQPGAAPVYAGFAGHLGVPGLGGEYWVCPAALARAADRTTPEVTVRHGPFVTDKKYDAIWVRTPTPDGPATWVFDVASGVLLMTSSTIHVAQPPGAPGQPQGGTHLLTRAVLAGQRVVTVPWADQPPPPAAIAFVSARYAGTFTPQGPPPAGAPAGTAAPKPLPRRVDFVVTERGPGWLRYSTTTVTGEGTPQSSSSAGNGVAGPVQLGGLWLPLAPLAALEVGRELDSDPWTRTVTRVAAADAASVTIAASNDSYAFTTIYDRASGLLTGVDLEDRVGKYRIVLRRER